MTGVGASLQYYFWSRLCPLSQTIPGCFHNWPKCVQRTALVTKTLPCTQLDSYTCGVSTFSKLLFQLKLSQSFEALVWEVKVPQCFCLARPGNKTKSFQEKNYFLPDLVRAHSSPCTVTATWKMISSSKNFKYFKTWSLGASGTSRPERELALWAYLTSTFVPLALRLSSSWFDRCIFELGDTNIQVGYPRIQEFHIRYNRQTTMVENNDHLL